MDENVIILGAGASADSGAPVMQNFLDVAEDLLTFNKLDDAVKVKFEKVFYLLSEMQKIHAKANMDLNNIEMVFGAIEMAQIINRLGDLPSDDIPTYRAAIVKLIIETIEQSMKFIFVGPKLCAPSSYGYLAETIKTKLSATNTSIITFNYDLGIDTALADEGYGVNYGFERLSAQRNPRIFNLYKLHGSINWVVDENDNQVYPYYPEDYLKDIKTKKMYNESGEVTLLISKFLGKIKETTEGNHKFSPEALIIPPTWNKNGYQGTISKVWAEAAEKLSRAKRIFIFGYSLPDSDLFFRYLFALGTLGSTRIRNIVVVNIEPPGGGVDNRFKNLLGSSIKSRYQYVNEYFKRASAIITDYIK